MNTLPSTSTFYIRWVLHSCNILWVCILGSICPNCLWWSFENIQIFADGKSSQRMDFFFSSACPRAVWFLDSSQVPQFCKSNHESIPPELPAQLWNSTWSGKGLGPKEWTWHVPSLKHWCGQDWQADGNEGAWEALYNLWSASRVLQGSGCL